MAGTRRAVIDFQVIRVACVKRLKLDFHLVTTGNGDAPRTALVVGVVVWVVWTWEVPGVAAHVSGWTTCKARKETIASLSGCQKLWMVQGSKCNSLQSLVLIPVLRSPILLIPNQLEISYRVFFSTRSQIKSTLPLLARKQCISEVVRLYSNNLSSDYKAMSYFWWGCRGNLKLITLRNERIKQTGPTE